MQHQGISDASCTNQIHHIITWLCKKNILMFLIVQTFVVTVAMYADPLLYYSDVDECEYHLKYAALDPQCIKDYSSTSSVM